MFTALRRILSILTAAFGIVVIAEPVWAQSAPTQALEEIVVTARKRNENFQDVPVTMDVFTAQEIAAAGIESPRDFIAMVPNMTLVETQNIGNSFITIRGISQARNSEPSVAVLVDGVLETNPYEFTQELYDIRQIEVLKGPQGALYGRDAIGGAIIIHTADPPDHFEASTRLGVGNGVSEKAQLALGGPLDSAGTLKYRASFNYYNTDGYLQNVTLDRKADPYRDYSGRVRLVWTPADNFSADLRFMYDKAETTAYYFVIPRSDEANPFTDFSTPGNANDTTSPIQNNNLGTDNRDIFDTALKLDYNLSYGTITSITNFNHTKEIDTGDAYDFRPVTTSVFYALTGATPAALGGPFDESQSQFIDVKTTSQELRFTSPVVGGFSWIAGGYFVHTKRFISTGNLADRGDGVPAVYYNPIVDPANPAATNTNQTFLSDSQDNNAWAVFGDATYEFNKQWELDVALRYDQDQRQNTTDTPAAFLPSTSAVTGEVRKATFSATQPKATVRFKPTDDWTFYGGWSRGFRSGGFNQTGVGAVAIQNGVLGVNDLFQAEIASTYEVGFKSQFLDRRLTLDGDIFHTQSKNGYFFVFIAADSTQNLGNLSATYKGAELSLTAHPTDQFDLYAGVGFTNSRITAMADPTVIGNEAPLVSRNTVNAGAQYKQPLGNGMVGTVRLDFNEIGRTWWEPYNITSRDPVSLVDLRMGLQGTKWTVTAWSKNLTNRIYNAEFSPGNVGGAGFLWRALPRRYGVDLDYKF
ncbi:MAG TPA: TonB-dependent receptor [Steroidobacteraceae bacterium]|jgi:iron complex outermembrane receptor protein|nr:TonB-dependent receptor [Steroidobacteraceae bacterium]